MISDTFLELVVRSILKKYAFVLGMTSGYTLKNKGV